MSLPEITPGQVNGTLRVVSVLVQRGGGNRVNFKCNSCGGRDSEGGEFFRARRSCPLCHANWRRGATNTASVKNSDLVRCPHCKVPVINKPKFLAQHVCVEAERPRAMSSLALG